MRLERAAFSTLLASGYFCIVALARAMFIHRLRENETFDPEAVQIMAAALDDALHELGLVHRDDPLVQSIARLIIIFAQQGENDPVKLRKLVPGITVR
jgi:hypothetical protein